MNNKENTEHTEHNQNESDRSDSSEEFVNIDEIYKYQNDISEIKNIYQIQLSFEKIIIKHISQNQVSPDIIIRENFGPNSKYNLYSCVYSEDELENFIKKDIFFPLIKLVEKDSVQNIKKIWSIAVQFNYLSNSNLKDIINKNSNEFKLFIVSNEKNNQKINYKLINKDIDQHNIVEKLIEFVIEKNS